MGFNTTVVFINDALDVLKDDPDFGTKLYTAIMKRLVHNKQIDVKGKTASGTTFFPVCTVIETHNANMDVYVKVGGNEGVVVDKPS